MSTTSSVSETSSTTSTVTNPKSQLTSDDFIQMMLTQLQNQDPLEPQDSSALLTQMSQIGQLQSSTELSSSLKSMVTQNQIASGGNLLGKYVEGQDDNGEKINGLVTAVRVIKDNVTLELDNGKELDMGNVTSITQPTSTTTAA